jgi:hypothetical protein
MIVECVHCGRQYDACEAPAASAVACQCGDLLAVAAPEDLEGEEVVKQFIERWARSCDTTADALAVADGWEFIAGSAAISIGHDAAAGTLTIRSSLLPLPQDEALRLALFQRLLELNYQQTGEARFALADDEVIVTFTRPTLGLDYHEFQQAVEQVARTADDFDDELRQEFLGDAAEIDLSEDEVG